MIEKVNPSHPDKLSDRIAGAIIDYITKNDFMLEQKSRAAIEVLIGHGKCLILGEIAAAQSLDIDYKDKIKNIVKRIASIKNVEIRLVEQDIHLAQNQEQQIKCGDNGIFKGVPLTEEEKHLSNIARDIYDRWPYDGKYILDGEKLIICQSNAKEKYIKEIYPNAIINPLGDWTGGSDVDSGATNRKLGSDMAQSVTGGGIHGKDVSKADVSVNIYCFLKAQETGEIVTTSCAIGDTELDIHIGNKTELTKYSDIVMVAENYIANIGGFEKFAEWGLY